MGKKRAVQKRENRVQARKLGEQELAKLRKLLKSKQAAAVITGCSLLESQEATAADFMDVFSQTVLSQLVDSWDIDVWNAVTGELRKVPGLKREFELLAAERFWNVGAGGNWNSFWPRCLDALEPALMSQLLAGGSSGISVAG